MNEVKLEAVQALMTRINPAKWDGPSVAKTLQARRELAKLKAQPELVEDDVREYLNQFSL